MGITMEANCNGCSGVRAWMAFFLLTFRLWARRRVLDGLLGSYFYFLKKSDRACVGKEGRAGSECVESARAITVR